MSKRLKPNSTSSFLPTTSQTRTDPLVHKTNARGRTHDWVESDSDSNHDSNHDSNQTTGNSVHPRNKNKSEEDIHGEKQYVGESPDERKVRLAKEYLNSLEMQLKEGKVAKKSKRYDQNDADITNQDSFFKAVGAESEEESDNENGKMTTSQQIEKILKSDIQKQSGRMAKVSLKNFGKEESVKVIYRLENPVTSIALSSNSAIVCSGSKDGNIVAFDVETQKKLHTFKGVMQSRAVRGPNKQKFSGADKTCGHVGNVLAIALNEDGNLVASGGEDKVVRLWDLRTNTQIKALLGHRDKVSAVAFGQSNTLYSGGFDRTIKVWDAAQQAYVESLFGHQAPIHSLDNLNEKFLSCSADKTCRIWKIAEEKHLVYNAGHTSAVDACKIITQQSFISGGQDGYVSLWSTAKKKPVAKVVAHNGAWITSVGAVPYSDILASGSSDGFLRLWDNQLNPVHQVPIAGFLNSIAFSTQSELIFVGVGQEHRFGRWERHAAARNGVHLVRFRK